MRNPVPGPARDRHDRLAVGTETIFREGTRQMYSPLHLSMPAGQQFIVFLVDMHPVALLRGALQKLPAAIARNRKPAPK